MATSRRSATDSYRSWATRYLAWWTRNAGARRKGLGAFGCHQMLCAAPNTQPAGDALADAAAELLHDCMDLGSPTGVGEPARIVELMPLPLPRHSPHCRHRTGSPLQPVVAERRRVVLALVPVLRTQALREGCCGCGDTAWVRAALQPLAPGACSRGPPRTPSCWQPGWWRARGARRPAGW